MCVMCFIVSTAPVSIATAKTEQTDLQIVKTVRSLEPHSEQLMLTNVPRPRVADVKTSSRDRAAALTGSDIRSNSRLVICYFVVIIMLLY